MGSCRGRGRVGFLLYTRSFTIAVTVAAEYVRVTWVLEDPTAREVTGRFAKRRHGAVGALLLAGVALTLAGAAAAAIVPQRGIGGVSLGMSQLRVRAVLGPPARVVRGSNVFGRYTELRYRGLSVSFQGNAAATGIETTRRGERTGTGVGVGSTEAQVRRGVRGVRCRTELGLRHCFVGRFLPGRRVTDFRLRRGRVVRVTVALVLD